MCSKNNGQRVNPSLGSRYSAFARRPAHSLRLRLMLWYGCLMLLGLSCFGVLAQVLASTAFDKINRNALNAETVIASTKIQQSLSALPPYWQGHLELEALDTYRTPGITIEVVDLQGNPLYSSDSTSMFTLKSSVFQALQQGQNSVWYNAQVSGENALVDATAIYAPPTSNAYKPPVRGEAGQAQHSAQMIGVLLVAKSLGDADATLILLKGSLLLTGALMLVLFIVCGWAVVGYALRPLSALVKTASTIATEMAHGKQVGNLHQFVKRPDGKDEMSQAVDAFNNMLNSIEDSTDVQRRFIADASHELRAPLTTIQGNLAFLIRHIEDIPPAERHTMLADAHGETLRLANLVDELLLLARADANIGQVPEPDQPAPMIEVDHVLLKLVRQMRRRQEIEGTALQIVIGNIEPMRVLGDEESLRRIIIILLDNAIKYTRVEDENGMGSVTVALKRVGNEAVLSVSDTGIGIESKDLPHIFERFYRADLARSRKGTGLGLAIAQTLVEQLNGQITAESQPGHGSTFRVWLALA